MFYSPRSAYTRSPRHTDRVLMSTSIKCRLQLVSGDESRIGCDFIFKGIDAPHDHKRKLVEAVRATCGGTPSPRTDFVTLSPY
jgi:hypothetical protein